MIPEVILKLLLAALFGAIIGFEREYRSKAAGFRTITMITLGSTLFTILSFKIGSETNHDRIAANIITGVGFIGAGVIFKDGLSVSGLTTASTIWVSAAIGMALGVSEYLIACCTLTLAIVILSLFEAVQDMIEKFHQVRTFRISFSMDYSTGKRLVEDELQRQQIPFRIKKITQTGEEVSFVYEVSGNQKLIDSFSEFLINTQYVKSFDE